MEYPGLLPVLTSDLQSIRPSNQLAPLADQLTPGKYGASWYPVLPAKRLAFYWTLSLRCFD